MRELNDIRPALEYLYHNCHDEHVDKIVNSVGLVPECTHIKEGDQEATLFTAWLRGDIELPDIG